MAAFVRETTFLVKSLDPNHLVGTGFSLPRPYAWHLWLGSLRRANGRFNENGAAGIFAPCRARGFEVCIGDDGGVGCADGFDLVLGRLLQAPSRTHCLLGQAFRSCGDVEEVSGAMGQKFPTDNSRGFRVNLATTSDTPSRLAKSLAKGEVTPNDLKPTTPPRQARWARISTKGNYRTFFAGGQQGFVVPSGQKLAEGCP